MKEKIIKFERLKLDFLLKKGLFSFSSSIKFKDQKKNFDILERYAQIIFDDKIYNVNLKIERIK